MNQAWLDERKSDLIARRGEFAERINRIKKDIGRGLAADSKEQVIQLENQEVLDALGNEAAEELRRIESALQKIETDEYGVCDACGEQIDPRRLEVRPYAIHCIACAE